MADENKYNIKIECGADFVLPFTWVDNNGNPYDLTGATVRAQLRESRSSSDGIDFVCQHNGAGGRIWLTMVSEATSVIPYSYGVYDVFVDFPDRTVRPLYGDVYVEDHVTKFYDGIALFLIGVEKYEDLLDKGQLNRLYFVYEDRRIYRWNGTNYVALAVGNGIKRIDFVKHVSPFIDRYRVTFDDLTVWYYEVTCKGIERIELIGSTGSYFEGITDTYRMYFNSGDYYDYDVLGGRMVFPYFDVDFDTGYLTVSDEVANLTFSINETTGMLSYSY